MSAVARRSLLALALCTVAVLASAGPAGAHPLGNFTTNQLVQVKIDRDEALVHYVLDQAEIPTFQTLQEQGASSSAELDAAGRDVIANEIVAEVRDGLRLHADGAPVTVEEPTNVALSFPVGQGGLELIRLEADFAAALPGGVTDVAVENDAFAGRRGWTAVQVQGGDDTDVVSSVPATDPTDGLRGYPSDLLSSPSDQRSATFEVTPGNGAVTAPKGLTSDEESTTDRSGDGFANALASSDTHGLLILLLLAAALGWGALHALSPGHGKAMVAGYLVGVRGTPRHAAILGVTVTATHTISVFALGLVTLALSQYILPQDLYPWLTLSSGILVIAIGVSVMRSRFLRWRRLRRSTETEEGHAHGHSHSHSHSHAPDGPITMRSLLALGVSGGMVPCPSALVVLIAAISQHRIGLGMLLITAFSIGLAATMTAVGLAVIWGGRAIRRLRPERALFGSRLAGALPALSALIIILAGVLISLRALPELEAEMEAGVEIAGALDFSWLFAPVERIDESLTHLLDGAPLLVALGIAFVLGLRHASDPDHLVAVTSLVAADRDSGTRNATRLGAWWGLGHAIMLLALGIPLIALHSSIPGWLESTAEKGIGLIIIVLAARVIWKWARGDYRTGPHDHSATHAPPKPAARGDHRHLSKEREHGHRPLRTPAQAFAIGTLHGLAGTGAVVVLLLAALPSSLEASLALAVFAPMSILSMAACTTAFAWILTRPIIEPVYRAVLIPSLGAFGLLFGLWYAGLG